MATTRPYSELDALLGVGNQRRIARLSGYQPNYVHAVLRAHCDCTLQRAAKMASAADVTIDELNVYIDTQRKERLKSVKGKVRGAAMKLKQLEQEANP